MTPRTPYIAITALAVILALGAGWNALAQDHSGHSMANSHAGHNMTTSAAPSTQAFIAANAKMHSEMDIAYTDDADVDFIRGMIPHHQGAVEMAQIVLDHGADAEVAELARAIIAAQETEIAWMRDWLAARGQ